MAQQSSLDVSKWQAARRQFQYHPALWFFYRMIQVAYLDARTTEPMIGPLRDGKRRPEIPTDEAILARDWIARSEPVDPHAYLPRPGQAEWQRREFISFPECCGMLSLDPEKERGPLLAAIDHASDLDTDQAWARLEQLAAREPVEDAAPLFDAPRVVPVLDQISLF
jgi:hypothetical protein